MKSEFLKKFEVLRKQQSEGKITEKDVANHFGLGIPELRKKRQEELKQYRLEQIKAAQVLKEGGFTIADIADLMHVQESTARKWCYDQL